MILKRVIIFLLKRGWFTIIILKKRYIFILERVVVLRVGTAKTQVLRRNHEIDTRGVIVTSMMDAVDREKESVAPI